MIERLPLLLPCGEEKKVSCSLCGRTVECKSYFGGRLRLCSLCSRGKNCLEIKEEDVL